MGDYTNMYPREKERVSIEDRKKKWMQEGKFYIADNNDMEALFAEIDRLTKENERLQLFNPCGHTGFESMSCGICGYPDSRKLIKYWQNRAERAEDKIQEFIYYESSGESDKGKNDC